jgi:hypothetical protein
MKNLLERVKKIDWKKGAVDAVEISIGAVGMSSVLLVDGVVKTGKVAAKVGDKTGEAIGAGILLVEAKCKEVCSDERMEAYKEKVKGFSVKSNK